jgi:hypothetical protein
MGGDLRVTGWKIICMGKAFTLGKTEENMMEIMNKIKSMALVYTTGQMEEYTKDNGQMESSMVKENTLLLILKLGRASGKMAEESDG